MERLGIFFEGLITPLLEWIKEDQIGPAIAGVIVIVGFIIIFITLARTINENNLITKAIKIINNRSEDDFAKDFNIINQDLNKIKIIKTGWSEFSETLINPRFDKDNNILSKCENTVRPQNYFNRKNLKVGPDFVKVFPSVFVGVGLSLTFLGLISALSEAVVAINASADNTASIQAAIANLLKISSAKFYASLFALFMSILLTISIRGMTWVISDSLRRLNQSIEAGIRFLTSERLALEANILMKDQLSQLQTFNTDLAMKIGQEVQSSLTKTLEPVIKKLDTMGGDLTEKNIEAIKTISSEVTKGIQGAAAGSMDRVAETLDEVSTKLGKLSDTLGGALANFDVEFRQMLEELKNSLKESTDDVADGIGASMKEMSVGIDSTAKMVSEIIGDLTGTVETLVNTGAEISRQGGDELRRQVEAASKQASDQMAEAGRELASGFRDSTQEFVSALNSASVDLRQLEKSLTGLPGQLDDVNLRLGTSATQVGEAADQFSSATSSIKDLVEPLAQYANDTRDSIVEITGVMETAASQVVEASSGIQDSISRLENQISGQLGRLDGADEKLAGLLSGIEDSTSRVLSEVNGFVTKVDTGFASSVGILQESINEFEEVVNAVHKLVEESRKV